MIWFRFIEGVRVNGVRTMMLESRDIMIRAYLFTIIYVGLVSALRLYQHLQRHRITGEVVIAVNKQDVRN
jgi:hypothetical protein